MSDPIAFIEGWVSPHTDPLAPKQTYDFDFDVVDAALAPNEATGNFGDAYDPRHAAAMLIRKMFLWFTDVPMNPDNAQLLAGRKALALAWVLDPGLFKGSPSAARLAKEIGIASASHFQALTGEASREFGIVNRAQSRGWNRGKVKPGNVRMAAEGPKGTETVTANQDAPQGQLDTEGTNDVT